jgi:hypothetical protein
MKATEPAKIIEIPDLYKWLPDDESAGEEGTEPEADQDTRESWRRSPEVEPVVIRPLAPKQHATEPDSLAVEGSGDAYAGKPGEGEQAGGGPGGGENEGQGGTGGTGADADKQREGGTAGVGGDGGAEPKPPIPVRSRIFLAEPATGTYRLVMEPAQTAVADVRVFAVGDDATVVPMRVREAWLDDGTKLILEADGTLITGLSFETKQVTRMWARVDSADRLSLEVTAHEA